MDLQIFQAGSPGLTVEAMDTPDEKGKRPGLRLKDEDIAALEAVKAAIPILQTMKDATLVHYLFRVGMDAILENPLRRAPKPASIIETARGLLTSPPVPPRRTETRGPHPSSPAEGTPTPGEVDDFNQSMKTPHATPKVAEKPEKKAPPFDPEREPTAKELRDAAKRARGGR